MKNRVITGVVFIILGSIIAFGPLTIFPVCGIHSSQQASGQESEQKKSQMSMGMGDKQASSADKNTTMSTMAKATGMVMKCFWTARAELGLGILIAILGALLIVFQSVQIRLGLNISIILNGIFALLIPTSFIGVCDGIHMACHSLTLPALIVLSSTLVLAAAVNLVYLYRLDKKGRYHYETNTAVNKETIDLQY